MSDKTLLLVSFCVVSLMLMVTYGIAQAGGCIP
jgi:hypothetical protein